MNTQSMPCPNCKKGKIHYTLETLLAGQTFKCDSCDISISLGTNGEELTKGSLDALEKLKHKK
ncbi:hypothetical protein [uncultured Kordia sp.]|uniref:hypothetical protein n=1 Tax=uncultured Kordia sp. TaxID=507699 RepID=UPI0026059F57|nr:hypothetical protein [uncultured Kordia sp.]